MTTRDRRARWANWMMAAALGLVLAETTAGQNAAPPPAAAAAAAPAVAPGQLELQADARKDAKPIDNSFAAVVFGCGALGIAIWLGLFGTLLSMIYFTIDCTLTVRSGRIIPPSLVMRVTESMGQGDVMKAMQHCKDEPGPMANILGAAFSHVEEGFDTIQEAVQVAADFESERLMQHISWLSVTASMSPMLGLLGTVQGMIMAFANLATGGAAQTGLLALAISQALWTTAAGLCVAIPAIGSFTVFRNLANRLTLRMQAITLDLIKDLRNVEVVSE